MEGVSLKSLLLGFIAGAIAMVTVHELVSYCLTGAGHMQREAWSMEPSVLTGYPQLATDAVFGGIWGAIFAILLGNPPRGSMTFKGILLGIIGPAVIGALALVPFLKQEPLFMGHDFALIWPVLVLGAAFGAATAWLYGFLTSGCRLP